MVSSMVAVALAEIAPARICVYMSGLLDFAGKDGMHILVSHILVSERPLIQKYFELNLLFPLLCLPNSLKAISLPCILWILSNAFYLAFARNALSRIPFANCSLRWEFTSSSAWSENSFLPSQLGLLRIP